MQPEQLLDWAFSFGGSLAALHPNEKRPIERDWQNKPLTRQRMYELREQLGDINYGLLLGEKYGNVVDVDLDSNEARVLGARFLPKAAASFGRSSVPRSHLLYIVGKPGTHKKWTDPVDGLTLVELRGTGHQSMLPPSIHPEGEPIIWSAAGTPEKGDWAELERACGRVAFAAFLAKHWTSWHGSIHFIAMALSGALLRSGLKAEEIELFIRSACEINHDTGTEMQVRTVADSQAALDEGKEVTGWPSLKTHLGTKVVDAMRSWLEIYDLEIPFEKSDTYNAKILVHHFSDRIRYNPEKQSWYVWVGNRWVPDVTDSIMNLAIEVGEIIRKEAMKVPNEEMQNAMRKHALSTRNLTRMRAMLAIAQSLPGVPTMSNQFDSQPMLLNCENGTLDLETQIIEQPRKDQLITRVTGCKYDPSASAPRFESFVERILPDDLTRRYVQKVLGYCLTANNEQQLFWIWYGPLAQNGKSTLISIVHAVMNDYSMHANKDSFIKQRTNRPVRDDIAHMDGARFISLSEPQERDVFDQALLKDWTGGEKMRARHLFQKEFEFAAKGKLVVPTNFLPGASAIDPGIWRRVRVVPFNVRIPDEERDNNLKDYIIKYELPGVLNWLVEGTKMYLRETLAVDAPEVEKATAEYKINNDSVGQFIAEMVEPDGSGRVDRAVVFEAYSNWCRSMGMRAVSVNELAKVLEGKHYTTVTIKGTKRWVGFRLKADVGDALFAKTFSPN